MPPTVITALDQVTPAWLTAVLTQSGALTHGTVAAFDADTGAGNWSANAQLTVRYSPDAQGALPTHLFLKLVKTDLDGESFDDSEVLYYTRDYRDVPSAPLVSCYDAAYAPDLHRYHILMDDLSATHVAASQKKPSLEYALALAEGLASMHARWWGAARLAEAHAPLHTPAHIQRFVDIAAPGVAHILPRFAAELAPHWPALIHTLFARHPQALIARTHDADGFTLIHGDAGEYNILVPRHDDRPIYLLDRQPFNWSLTTWLGVYDLVYALVLDSDIETRRALERPALQRYHATLQACGVHTYSWEQLYNDYRLCVPIGVYIAVEYARGGVIEKWAPLLLRMLQRTLTACDDLNCAELWQA